LSKRRKNILVLAAGGIALVIVVSVIGAIHIALAPVFTLVLYAGLVAVTVVYVYILMETAAAARQQAEASVKMAEETKEQRYDTVRPVIDIQRDLGEQIREGLAAQSEEFSYGLWCTLRNIGVGPAIDVYSYVRIDSERQLWPFGTLPIGEPTLKKRLSLEHTGDRMVLVAYYKDVYGRDFGSRREVTLDQERSGWKIGPLEIEVRKIAKEEPTKMIKEAKKAGLSSFIFVGCLIIGLGVGIGFNLMPEALIIGIGVGLVAMGIARYKTGKW